MTQEVKTLEEIRNSVAEPVKPHCWYRISLQLGARQRWRGFGGGRWKRDTSLDARADDGRLISSGYRHHPQMHTDIVVSGGILNGLLETQRKWIKANRDEVPAVGDIGRMIFIAECEECDAPPARLSSLEVIEKLVERLGDVLSDREAKPKATRARK